MKKKFKKKLLFYVILLLITFCISHFVNADTDSNLVVPPFYSIKANNVNLLSGNQYTESENSTTFYINLNTNVVYNNVWPDYSIRQNIFNKYLIVNVCSLWTIPTQFYYNKTGWSSAQVYMNNGSCFIDGYEGTLSTVILGWDYDKLDAWEESSTTTTYKISMYSNRNNFTFQFYYPNTRTIHVDSIYSSDTLPDRIPDISGITKEQEKTNQKLDNINSSLTDSSPISLEKLNDTAGWLPAGPVDSILNLPLSLLNNLSTNLNKQCTPISLNIPFLDKNNTLVLPCLANTLSENVEDFDTFYSWLGLVVSCLLLYKYLMSLYVWVDNVLMLRLEMYEDFGGKPTNFGSV